MGVMIMLQVFVLIFLFNVCSVVLLITTNYVFFVLLLMRIKFLELFALQIVLTGLYFRIVEIF